METRETRPSRNTSRKCKSKSTLGLLGLLGSVSPPRPLSVFLLEPTLGLDPAQAPQALTSPPLHRSPRPARATLASFVPLLAPLPFLAFPH